MVFVSIKMSQFLVKNAFFLSKAPINAAQKMPEIPLDSGF